MEIKTTLEIFNSNTPDSVVKNDKWVRVDDELYRLKAINNSELSKEAILFSLELHINELSQSSPSSPYFISKNSSDGRDTSQSKETKCDYHYTFKDYCPTCKELNSQSSPSERKGQETELLSKEGQDIGGDKELYTQTVSKSPPISFEDDLNNAISEATHENYPDLRGWSKDGWDTIIGVIDKYKLDKQKVDAVIQAWGKCFTKEELQNLTSEEYQKMCRLAIFLSKELGL